MRPGSNKIGKEGATKLIQYAHWERDRFKDTDKPPSHLKLDLSDNCIDRPAGTSPSSGQRSTQKAPTLTVAAGCDTLAAQPSSVCPRCCGG